MAVTPSRVTLTTAPVLVAINTNRNSSLRDDTGSRRWRFLPQTRVGIVLIGGAATGVSAPNGGAGARWDVARLPFYGDLLEPGEELWMCTVTGTVEMDIMVFGR